MDWIQQWQSKLNKQNGVAPLVRTGGSRHTGLRLCRTVIFISEILYFKSDDKKIRIILTNGEEISFYGKLKDIRMSVPENSFLVIHKSYMVNYEYVNEYTYEWVKMINGDILNISKAHRKEVRSQLMQYEQ